MNKKMMREDDDIENMGIMQGFMDSMADEGDDEGEGEDPEMMMERRPDSPEILMNNLRGDMRSVDARRDELADLVGYQAATETPEQVLAMLQPILAQQGGGGIGALPQSAPMAQGPQPPMMGGAPGMPPPGMPPMPPDAGMAPPPPDQGGIAALMASMGGGAPGGEGIIETLGGDDITGRQVEAGGGTGAAAINREQQLAVGLRLVDVEGGASGQVDGIGPEGGAARSW